jgi:hypothetical protein
MPDAFVIQSGDLTAGIVIVERGGVRFYASEREFHGLDGRIFKSIRAARQAVDRLQLNPPPPHRPISAQGQAA